MNRIERVEKALDVLARQEQGAVGLPDPERAAEIMARMNLSEEARAELLAAATEGRPVNVAILRRFDYAGDAGDVERKDGDE